MSLNYKNLFVLVILFFPLKAFAFSQFMEIYDKDKFSKPEFRNMCSVCHINPNGGGPLNNFGKAFDANGMTITNDLRQKFPNLFDLAKTLAPRIIRIKPQQVKIGQEVTLAILGNNFSNDDDLQIDGSSYKDISGTEIIFVNSKKINLSVTFSEPGIHKIKIVNIIGQSSNIFKIKVKSG